MRIASANNSASVRSLAADSFSAMLHRIGADSSYVQYLVSIRLYGLDQTGRDFPVPVYNQDHREGFAISAFAHGYLPKNSKHHLDALNAAQFRGKSSYLTVPLCALRPKPPRPYQNVPIRTKTDHASDSWFESMSGSPLQVTRHERSSSRATREWLSLLEGNICFRWPCRQGSGRSRPSNGSFRPTTKRRGPCPPQPMA